MTYYYIKYIFHVKIHLFVTAQSDHDPDQDLHGSRIGLAPWIWICIEVESWIWIHINQCESATGKIYCLCALAGSASCFLLRMSSWFHLWKKEYLFSQDVQEQPFHFGEQQTFLATFCPPPTPSLGLQFGVRNRIYAILLPCLKGQ